MRAATWLWIGLGIAVLAAGGVVVYSTNRGIRNNNPGNIRDSDGVVGPGDWQGQVGVDDVGFCIFAQPSDGFRALYKTLLTYRNSYGIDTIAGILNRYAPPSENDTAAYITDVSQQVGWPVDVSVPLARYPDLVAAIAHHETGKWWDVAQIDAGIAAA